MPGGCRARTVGLMAHSIAARFAAVLLVPVLALVVSLSFGATQAQAVVGGRDATTKQYPWMVFLSRVGDTTTPSGQFCGGALVAPTKVVTAAHCIDDLAPEQFRVIGGRTNLHGQDGTVRDVVTVWNAPRVPPPAAGPGDPPFIGGGDLSVLTLDEPMPYRTLRMMDVDDGWRYTPGRRATVLGWGIYQEHGLVGPSPVLQQGRIPMRGYNTCNEAAKAHPARPFQLDPRFYVCGGWPDGGPAVCGGDSGSPLVIDGRLAGVVGPILSRGGTVCEDAYSGYTRTDVYADLIREEIGR